MHLSSLRFDGGTAVKKINRVVHEADATVRESQETGAPIDEVFDMRAERQAEHVAASQPVVDDYNDL